MADASSSPHQPGSNPPGSHPPGSNQPGWSDVFAALPLAAPPASAWPAIAARLDQKKTHAHNRTWLALAASLFALTALPVTWILRDADRDTGPVATSPDTIVRTITENTPPVITNPIIATAVGDRSAQTQSIAADILRPAHAVIARSSADREQRRTKQTVSASNIAQSQEDTDTSLEPLYAASTQLETLLTFARDTRAESGPAAALASAFDAELATIDAQLAQPGLAAQQQQALWQARVDTLQQATGFEANQRLLSAEGRRYDGALVSVD